MQAPIPNNTHHNNHTLTPTMNTIYTHAYQGTIFRFSDQNIHILQICDGKKSSQEFMDATKIRLELDRCSLKTNHYKFAMVVGHHNYVIAFISVQKDFFVACINIKEIKIGIGILFRAPILEIQELPQLPQLLKLGLIGFNFGFVQRDGLEVVNPLSLALHDAQHHKIHQLLVIIGEKKARAKFSTIEETPGSSLRINFIQNYKKCLLISQRAIRYYVMQVNTAKKLQRWREVEASQIGPNTSILQGPYLIVASHAALSVTLVKIFKKQPESHKFSFLSEAKVEIQYKNIMLKGLYNKQEELIVGLYHKDRCFLLKKDSTHNIQSSEIQIAEPLTDIQAFSQDQIILFYQASYQTIPLFDAFHLLSSAADQPDQTILDSSDLTYSSNSSSAQNIQTSNSRFSRQKNLINKKQQSQINPYRSAENVTNSFPSPKAEHRPKIQTNNNIEGIEHRHSINPTKAGYQNILKPKPSSNMLKNEDLNRVGEAVISQAKSQDQDQNVYEKSPTKPLQLQQRFSHNQIPPFDSGAKSPQPFETVVSSANNLISFGVQQIRSLNSEYPHESVECISFNPNDIKRYNAAPIIDLKASTGKQEQIVLPLTTRTFSFGDHMKSTQMVSQPQVEGTAKRGQRTQLGKQREAGLCRKIAELQWKFNTLKQFNQIKDHILSQSKPYLRNLEFIDYKCRHYSQRVLQIKKIYHKQYNTYSEYGTALCQTDFNRFRKKLIEKKKELNQSRKRIKEILTNHHELVRNDQTVSSLSANMTRSTEDRLWQRLKIHKLHLFNLQLEIRQLKVSTQIHKHQSQVKEGSFLRQSHFQSKEPQKSKKHQYFVHKGSERVAKQRIPHGIYCQQIKFVNVKNNSSAIQLPELQ